MLEREVNDSFHLFPSVDGPGRVVGGTEEDGPSPVGDTALDLIDRREGEPVLGLRRDGDDFQVIRRSIAVVVGVVGLEGDDLLARIGDNGEGEGDRLASPVGDDDLLGGDLQVVVGEVFTDCLPEVGFPLGVTVGNDGSGEVPDGVDDLRGGVDVGLADVQMVDIGAPLLSGVCEGDELPDRGSLHR